MHHQTMHGVGPNHSDQDPLHIYFRLTAAGRPEGSKESYVAAMLNPALETRLLPQLSKRQQFKKARKTTTMKKVMRGARA